MNFTWHRLAKIISSLHTEKPTTLGPQKKEEQTKGSIIHPLIQTIFKSGNELLRIYIFIYSLKINENGNM